MDSRVKAWLYDVLNSINEIESYFQDQPKLLENYKADTKTKRAVERDLEIIGEAVNRITTRDSSIIIENSSKIVSTRNYIIHSYDSVSDEMVWSIIVTHIPKLKKEVEELLKE